MRDYKLLFWGIPIEEITRDVKDGKIILKTKGNINGNTKAQTVIVYGNVTGPIEAEQVVIINGNATGNIKAGTVTKLESKEEKTCKSCKYYTEENCISSLFYCKEKKSAFIKNDIKICGKYQKKENPARQVSSPVLPTKRRKKKKKKIKSSIKDIKRVPVISSYH